MLHVLELFLKVLNMKTFCKEIIAFCKYNTNYKKHIRLEGPKRLYLI